MDNTVNKKTKLSKKLKNKESEIDSNENQRTFGKKRKKLDTEDGLTQPQKSKKKKIDATIEGDMLNNICQGSSQIVKCTKTRSKKSNIEVNSVEREDNIENINEPLRYSKKSKKKTKDENSQGEANIQVSDPILEDIPLTRQKTSKNKKKNNKLEDELHSELHIKTEENQDFNPEFFSHVLDGCAPSLKFQKAVSTNPINLQLDNYTGITEKNEKKQKHKRKGNEQQIHDDSILGVTKQVSSDTDCSTNAKPKKKSRKKIKLEVVPESTECSNGLTNILADYLPITFGQEENVNVNTTTCMGVDTMNIEDITIKKRKKKTKTSQLASNNESVIVSNQNVIDQSIRTALEENTKKTKSFNQEQDKSIIDVGGNLNILTLNNNDVAVKTEVNIIDIKSEETGDNNENVVHISIRDVGVPVEENDLLKQLEKKITTPKKRDSTTWPLYDLQKLLSRIEISIPQNDGLPFLKRYDRIEWDSVIFDNYTVEQCKEMWLKLQKRVRKFRLFNEVLQDAKDWVRNNYAKNKTPKKKSSKTSKHPDMPRKPLTPYFIYYLEYRDSYQKSHPGIDASAVAKALALQFTSLSPEIKKKYDEISVRNREQYNKDMEEFYRKHPEVPRGGPKQKVERPPKPPKLSKPPKISKPPKEKPPVKPPKEKIPIKPRPPFFHFYISELEKDNIEDKIKFKEMCKDKWKQLPERNKLVWIHFAEAEAARYEQEMAEYVKKHPDYIKMPIKPILTREDIQIKERAAGKPVKPPGSAYNLFASTLLHSDGIKDVPVRDRLMFASNQWKYCTEQEKLQYKEKFEEMVKKYQEDYAAYLESLTEEQRAIEIAKNVPKKKPEKPKEEAEKKKEIKKKQPNSKATTQQNKKVLKQPKAVTATVTTDISVEMKLNERLEKLKEPEQPPISPMKYFAKLYTGTESVVQAWKSLAKDQKKFYEQELDKKKREYIKEFEKFLNSLTKEELEIYSSRKKMKQQEEKEQSDESNSDDSEDSSDEDDENVDDNEDD